MKTFKNIKILWNCMFQKEKRIPDGTGRGSLSTLKKSANIPRMKSITSFQQDICQLKKSDQIASPLPACHQLIAEDQSPVYDPPSSLLQSTSFRHAQHPQSSVCPRWVSRLSQFTMPASLAISFVVRVTRYFVPGFRQEETEYEDQLLVDLNRNHRTSAVAQNAT